MKPALSVDNITLDKQIFITVSAAIINVFFILIYAFNNLSGFDKILMFMMYLFNTMTMYFLEVKDVEFLNIMHMCMVFCFMLTIFIDNIYYIFLMVLVLIQIQLMWVKYGRCILFNDKEGWGFGLAPHIGATTYTAFLSYKIGIKSNINHLKSTHI
jgi:hypothetical protein